MTRREFVAGSILGPVALASGIAGAAPAAEDRLPKGKIGKLEVSRMLLGGNLLTHFTHSRDLAYVYNLAAHYNTKEKILETLAAAEANGIDTLVVHTAGPIVDILREHREKRGGKMKWIICPTADIVDGLEAYAKQVGELLDVGCDSIYLWGVRGDALVGAGRMDLVRKAVEIPKAKGVPSGVGAHLLSVIQACEKEKIPADFYLKTLHHHEYPSAKLGHDSVWCTEPRETIEFMRSVEKPWIAFKTMAAGAIPPPSAFRYAIEGGADFIISGMFDYEIAPDVKILKDILASSPKRQRPWRA